MTENELREIARHNGRNGAYPVPHDGFEGMSLREWLAGLAMSGLLTRRERDTPKQLAGMAVEQADALLLALARPRETPGPPPLSPATLDSGEEIDDMGHVEIGGEAGSA